jgi:hypothetical protein
VQREVPGAQQQAEDGQVDCGRDEDLGFCGTSVACLHSLKTVFDHY